MGNNELNQPCNWSECNNNPDWFNVSCIGQKINLWKVCKKKGITPVQAFMNCPYCGNRVNLHTIKRGKKND